jgi:hypothetical protein
MLKALEFRANILRIIEESIDDIVASDVEPIAVMIAMLICVEVGLHSQATHFSFSLSSFLLHFK